MARSINRLVSLQGGHTEEDTEEQENRTREQTLEYTQNLVTQNPAPTPNLGKATVSYIIENMIKYQGKLYHINIDYSNVQNIDLFFQYIQSMISLYEKSFRIYL